MGIYDQRLGAFDYWAQDWGPKWYEAQGWNYFDSAVDWAKQNAGEWTNQFVNGVRPAGAERSQYFASWDQSWSTYNTIWDQKDEMARLAQEAVANEQKQREEVDALRAQQALRIGSIQAAGNAVTQSLRILGSQGQQQAPTAAMAPAKKKTAGPAATTASLRIGATSRGAGAGTNLSI